MRQLGRIALGVSAACALVVASGCTNSQVLSTGNSGFAIQVEIQNPLTRFSNNANAFERAVWEISQLTVRPTDPVADASLGPSPIGVISDPSDVVRVDLKSLTGVPPSELTLSDGKYIISSITISNLQFIDYDRFIANPPVAPTSCSDFAAYAAAVTVVIRPADFGADVDFSIGGVTPPVRVLIDGAALTQAFTESFNCTLPASPFAQLTAANFRSADFIAKAPLYIRVVQ